jgi:DNA-binding XRE family transcriptional regulator
MAQSIDVAESTCREWEKGRGMKLPPFQRISQVLAISVTELMTGEIPVWAEVIDELARIEKKIAELRLELTSRI